MWSGRAQPAEFWVPADAGLALPWTAAGTVEVLDDWLRHTGGAIGMDRRIFPAVSGAMLTAPAWGYVDHLGAGRGLLAALADERRGITVTSAMVDADAPGALDTRPSYLGWFGPENLEGQLAQGALTLAAVTSRDSRVLLDSAENVLGRTATDPASTPRNAVFHAAWLSRAQVAADNLDRAVLAAQTALRRLPTVRSRRCALVLRHLEEDLAALPPARRPASVRSPQDQLHASRTA